MRDGASAAARMARRQRRARAILLAAAAAIAAELSPFRIAAPLLAYNATASAPLGFYRVRLAGELRRGDLVLAMAPLGARRLAAKRRYLPAGVPLVKRIAALADDRVCAASGVVAVDGHPVAKQLAADSEGRPLPAWHGCRVLGVGQLFLLMANVRDSFDSRYFGPIAASAVIGRLTPLWTW